MAQLPSVMAKLLTDCHLEKYRAVMHEEQIMTRQQAEPFWKEKTLTHQLSSKCSSMYTDTSDTRRLANSMVWGWDASRMEKNDFKISKEFIISAMGAFSTIVHATRIAVSVL